MNNVPGSTFILETLACANKPTTQRTLLAGYVMYTRCNTSRTKGIAEICGIIQIITASVKLLSLSAFR